MREINYVELIEKIDTMINTLEYDGMRSPGKAKLNSQHLHSLYFLKELYESKMIPKKKPIKGDK